MTAATTRHILAVGLVWGVLAWPGLAQVKVPDSMPPHRWKSISHTRPAGAPLIQLTNDTDRGFLFTLSYIPPRIDGGPRESELVVRLHLKNGTIVQPLPEPTRGQVGGCFSSGGCFVPYFYVFPWQENALEEAWIESRLPGATYWFEIPYGFTRNPADRLTPIRALSGSPDIAPAMRSMGERDQIVPWNYVEYAAQTGDGWSPTVRIANPFRTDAEIVLDRFGTWAGRNKDEWGLLTPRTSITVDAADGRLAVGQPTGLRMHDDRVHRSDTFRMDRSLDELTARNALVEARGWGTVRLSVDEQTYRFTVPSSLFLSQHGRPTYPRTPLDRVPLR